MQLHQTSATPSVDLSSVDSTTVYESSYNSDLDDSPTGSESDFEGPVSFLVIERECAPSQADPLPTNRVPRNTAATQRAPPSYTERIPAPSHTVARGTRRQRGVQTSPPPPLPPPPPPPPLRVDCALSRRPSVTSLVSGINGIHVEETLQVSRAGSSAAALSVSSTPDDRPPTTYHTANSQASSRPPSIATPLPAQPAFAVDPRVVGESHDGHSHGQRSYTTFTTTQPLASFSVTFRAHARPPSSQSSTTPSERRHGRARESIPVTPVTRRASFSDDDDVSPPRSVSAISRRPRYINPSVSVSATPARRFHLSSPLFSRCPSPPLHSRAPSLSEVGGDGGAVSSALASPPATPGRAQHSLLPSPLPSHHSVPSSPLVPPSSPRVLSPTTHVPSSPSRRVSSLRPPHPSPLPVPASLSSSTPPVGSSYDNLCIIVGKDNSKIALDVAQRMEYGKYFVVTWGWQVGVFHTWKVAGEHIRSCSMAMYQTFNDPKEAVDIWVRVVREGSFCRIRRELSLPPRETTVCPPGIVTARYWYLHPPSEPSRGVTVIFRGLQVGVFPTWLLVAHYVAGIRGALFNGFKTFEEAREAFAAAKEDGIVMKLTLREPMPARFFELSD